MHLPCRVLCLALLTFTFPIIAGAQSSPSPVNGAKEISVNPTLSWTGPAGAVKFDVLLDQTSSPSKPVATNLTSASFQVTNSLEAGATYYWSIRSYDSHGNLIPGAAVIWSFTVSSTPVIPATGSQATSTLQSLGFGVALSLQWNVFKPDIVNDAEVDQNGIVRVNTRANTTAGFMLEMHYLIWKWPHDQSRRGTGPFVAVQPGTDQVISAVGAGWMIDWKVDQTSRKGFGLGFGYAARPSAKTLGNEFVGGQPAPKDPTTGQPLPIRFETRDKGSVLAVLSFTF